MATTNGELALTAVQGLTDAGVEYAFLHGVERLLSGDVSDLDLVAPAPARTVLTVVAPYWLRLGLHPVLFWPYDVGDTATIFLSNADATDGVQLDLLHDPRGAGKYGIRTQSLLTDVTNDTGMPEISPSASLVYQWTKRVAKGQLDRLPDLRDRAKGIETSRITEASLKLTGSESTALELLGQREPGKASKRPVPGLAEVRRRWRRVLRPIGFWGHIEQRDVAEEATRRFGRFLVHAECDEAPGKWTPVWYARRVWPVVIRPSIFISAGRPSHIPSPFELVKVGDPNRACSQLVGAMQRRLMA